MRVIFILFIFLFPMFIKSQGNVGINSDNSNPDPSAMLDVKSTTGGILIPRMSSIERIAITSPADGLLVFDTDFKNFLFYNQTTGSWIELKPDIAYSAGTAISIVGNTIHNTGDTDPSNDIVTGTFAAGDLAGNYPWPSVIAIQGRDISPAPPGNNQVLKWNNASARWEPADDSDSAGDITGVTAGTGLNGGGTSGTVTLQIAVDGVTVAHIAPNAVGSSEIVNGSITEQDLDINAVTMTKMADNAIGNAEMADNAIGSAEIINSSVTAADMTSGAATSGQVLTANGSGATSWLTPAVQKVLADSDNDTKIQVEKNFNENIIRFDLAGQEQMTLIKNANLQPRLEIGTGTNLAVGNDALLMDDPDEGSYNTAIGNLALNANFNGAANTANGYQALYLNTSGDSNTAIGHQALFNNKGNSRSTAIGYEAMSYADNRISGRLTYNTALGCEALRGSTTAANNTGQYNTAIGDQALVSNTSGHENTAIGAKALYDNSSGSNNTANGVMTLYNNTTGNNNTAIGFQALCSNTTGDYNTANGYYALRNNSEGIYNTANGYYALYSNTTGNQNTANGNFALYFNKANSRCTAIGPYAMYHADDQAAGRETFNTAVGFEALKGSLTPANNIGRFNSAIGDKAMYSITSGDYNTSVGYISLELNNTGHRNTAIGGVALNKNTSGYQNTAVGTDALRENTTGDQNTATGFEALINNTSGNNNTALGYTAFSNGTNYTNSTGIGYDAEPGASNKIMLGNSSVTWVGCMAGQFATTSDARVKNHVREDVKGLDFISRLRPITYYFDKDQMDDLTGTIDSSIYSEKYDVETIKFSGFVAQEVEQAAFDAGYTFSGLIRPEGDVKYYSIAYAAFVVPLVKAVQEQQAMIEELQQINQQISGLKSVIHEQKELIRKQSEFLESMKSLVNNQD